MGRGIIPENNGHPLSKKDSATRILGRCIYRHYNADCGIVPPHITERTQVLGSNVSYGCTLLDYRSRNSEYVSGGFRIWAVSLDRTKCFEPHNSAPGAQTDAHCFLLPVGVHKLDSRHVCIP